MGQISFLTARICADKSESSSHVILRNMSLARSQLLQRMKYAIASKCVTRMPTERLIKEAIAEAAVALGYSQVSSKQAQALV